jgi:septin 3/9/12
LGVFSRLLAILDWSMALIEHVSLRSCQFIPAVVVENNVKLRLNIVDTPGYGDLVNNDGCWEPIIKYIKDQHSAYLRKELTAQRDKYIQDTRIHCCIYFISPTGHGLRVSFNFL